MTLLNIFGIANAYADTAAPAAAAAATTTATPGSGQNLLSLLPMLVVLVLFMYFMIIRPQSKRAKDHRNLVSGLQKGDEVATTGGMLGRIEKITDTFIVLSIADGVNITVQKNAILNSLPKGTIKSI